MIVPRLALLGRVTCSRFVGEIIRHPGRHRPTQTGAQIRGKCGSEGEFNKFVKNKPSEVDITLWSFHIFGVAGLAGGSLLAYINNRGGYFKYPVKRVTMLNVLVFTAMTTTAIMEDQGLYRNLFVINRFVIALAFTLSGWYSFETVSLKLREAAKNRAAAEKTIIKDRVVREKDERRDD